MIADAQPLSAQPMPLPQLLGSENGAFADIMISGMQLDSRKVQRGDLFLALPGELHDGRQFIEQAVANGAAAVVAEARVAGFVDAIPVPLVELPELHLEAGILASRFYRNPSLAMQVIGVTGTNGKTTTSRIVAQLLRALGRPCGVIGTLGNTLDDEVTTAINTTPDALSLQQQLAEALIEYDLLRGTTNDNDPRLTKARQRIDVIRERIMRERENFTQADVQVGGVDYPTLIAEFEGLVVDREFAEEGYRAALTALDLARNNAQRQSRYLAAYIQPTFPQSSEFPRRWVLLGMIGLFAVLIWSILALIYYSSRDSR